MHVVVCIHLYNGSFVQAFVRVRSNLLRNTARMLEISHESVKGMPNPVQIVMYP